MSDLKPWVYGPFELLQHAEDHLHVGSDFDKRMALICFDNSIEVSITTFLQLHPSQRNGKTFPRESVSKWLANYHSKIDFLGQHAADRAITLAATTDEIVWFHALRNELYHSGNGMVPEQRALAGIRSAAFSVFSVLFDVDPETCLTQGTPSPEPVSQPVTPSGSAQMTLLQAYIDLEKTLQANLRALAISDPSNSRLVSAAHAWKLFESACGNVPQVYSESFQQANRVRNQIVHGQPTDLDENQLVVLTANVEQLSEFVASYGFSFDILEALTRRFPRWIRPEITGVRVVQKKGNVYVEITERIGTVADERVNRTDLSFIVNDIGDEEAMFSPRRTAEENARVFVDQLDPFSIVNCTDLFTKDACREVFERYGPECSRDSEEAGGPNIET
jgi:hypothetical protein